MLDSETINYKIRSEVTPQATTDTDDVDICVWLSSKLSVPDAMTSEELEALVHRGTVRELLAEERRQA